ncbi:T9SS type A sorting domain-containing protein [Polaribacter sejongensis]|uniref:galactose-binding domain-containing protein n=1 Tax=Polaribacter sejongensis TaxID=985043 RepID=UPI0035A6F060
MKKAIFTILVLVCCVNINGQNHTSEIYTNDMDYVLGDAKQAFIQDKIKTKEQADNLLQGFINLKVNGIRIPIYAEGLNPNKEMFDYFYTIAVEAGFPIFANPAQSSGGHRIARGVLNTTESLCDVKNDANATNILIERIKDFAAEYKCKWINAFNEDGRTNNPWTPSQMNTIYSSLYNNVNGAELIGSCAWGIPASIDVMNNTNIEDYITVAATHNLGFNHSSWPTFINLAKAKGLPVWDSEVNHNDAKGNGTRLEKALEYKVDGLVMYNLWNSINLTDGSVKSSGETLMALYLKPEAIPENIALTGTATQSSTNPQFNKPASLAIDGDTNGNYGSGSVTVTNNEENPWWQVDLGTEQKIGEIKVFNRTDACCADRMSNFTVSVLNSAGVSQISQTYTTHPNPSITFDAGGALGQIVKVQLNITQALTLAEVQVFAPDAPLSTENHLISNVNIYPNPVADKLVVSDPDAVFNQFTVYNINGQVIKSGKISSEKVEINTVKFSKGIYFIKLEGVKSSETHKIVKK